ncbi:MAG: DUF2752 domain-containing protein [Bacteroidia bacterium]
MNKLIELSLRIAFLLLPGILLLLPADFFDTGRSICIFKNLTGMDCPGCGLTRATQHLLHWDWQKAMQYNPLVIVTSLILGWIWIKNLYWLYIYWKGQKPEL